MGFGVNGYTWKERSFCQRSIKTDGSSLILITFEYTHVRAENLYD
jgi:hypothetical protein